MTLIRDFDEATITALIAQDDQAFKQLVKAFHPMLKKLAASIVGESIAEDVAQDAWISIYQNLPQFERRSSLKTWVYRITSNKAISRQRREGKVVAFSELSDAHDDDIRRNRSCRCLVRRSRDDGIRTLPEESLTAWSWEVHFSS